MPDDELKKAVLNLMFWAVFSVGAIGIIMFFENIFS